MENIGGFGLSIDLVASVTYPSGITITQFADDADPFDSESIPIADKAMGLNGDLLVWSKPTPLPISISVVPGSDDDLNLAALADANRVGKGKISARDVISISCIYPDGTPLNLPVGVMTDAPTTPSIQSSARMKSQTYKFAFETKA
jgi:hypothetical protein